MPFTNKFCNISFLILSLQNIGKLLIIINNNFRDCKNKKYKWILQYRFLEGKVFELNAKLDNNGNFKNFQRNALSYL